MDSRDQQPWGYADSTPLPAANKDASCFPPTHAPSAPSQQTTLKSAALWCYNAGTRMEGTVGTNINRRWRNWTQRLEGPYIQPSPRERIWTKDKGALSSRVGRGGSREPERMCLSTLMEEDMQDEDFTIIDHDGNELETSGGDIQEHNSWSDMTITGNFWSPRPEREPEISTLDFLAELRYTVPPAFTTERAPPRQIVFPTLHTTTLPIRLKEVPEPSRRALSNSALDVKTPELSPSSPNIDQMLDEFLDDETVFLPTFPPVSPETQDTTV